MSMREYPICDWGIVLSSEEVTDFGKTYIKNLFPQKFEEEKWEEANIWEITDEIDFIDCYSDFVGDVIPINEEGNPMWDIYKYINSENVFVISTKKIPHLFKAAYSSRAALIQEYKDLYPGFFPQEFNFESHLSKIVGTVLG